MTAESRDPRPARSRARLLDAAAALLRAGGPSAVTVDAVTGAANVARATLYRHFGSGDDLRAAAFQTLLPRSPMPPEHGSLRERLTALVGDWAELIAETPITLTAMSWLALGGGLEQVPDPADVVPGRGEMHTLRERVARLYAEPFDAIFDSAQAAAELHAVDRGQAAALLLGPVVVGKLSTLADFDYRECARAAVEGFLHVYAKTPAQISAVDTESAGA